MKCANCNQEINIGRGLVTRDDYTYCSLTCAELHRRSRLAVSALRELTHVSAFSVLAEPDRQTLAAAKRWLRHMWLEATPGYSMTLDGIDHDAVFEVLQQIEDLYARTTGEPQLAGGRR